MEEAEVLNYVKAAAQAVGVPLDEARAQAVAQHAAEILQRATRDFVVAATVNLEAAGALLEFHTAARQDTPVGGRRGTGRN